MQWKVNSAFEGIIMRAASIEINHGKQTPARKQVKAPPVFRQWGCPVAAKRSVQKDRIQYATERDVVIRHVDSIIWLDRMHS